MTFEEWSNQRKKKDEEKHYDSFSDWSNDKFGTAPSYNLTNDEKDDDIAPITSSGGNENGGSINSGDFFGWLGDTAMAGVNAFNQGLFTTADIILGKPLQALGWEDNPISTTREYYDNLHAGYQQSALEHVESMGGGKGWDYATRLVEGTVSAVPDALLSFMTAGTSTGASIASKGVVEGGSLLTRAGLTVSQMAKNPSFWTSFAQTYGTSYEEAVDDGADELTAAFTATFTSLINSGIEVGIDGGSGIQGLTNDILDGNKSALQSWVESSLEEGAEEVLQSFVTNAVAKVTYDSDRELANIGEMAQDFTMGAAIGGILGGGQFAAQKVVSGVQEIASNRLTESEKAVVDKVFEDAVADRESNGTRLTNREKNNLYDSIVDMMEKGGIDIDTIESVLGGDTYSTFRNTVDTEEGMKAELAELRKMESGKMNDIQRSRMEELKGMNLTDTSKREDIRKRLNDIVFPQIRGSRLAESYNQVAQRGNVFTADLSKYTGKQKEAVQRAIDSGVLNNTYYAHELVDILAKIEADKGIVFDYTNNEKLKESGFALDGKTVNGFKNKGVITLNIQSAKAWQSTVGHEITHVLQGTDHYEALQNALFETAKSKGEFDSRRAELAELYKDVAGANIDEELTADLVGDYLFTNKEFINHLTGNRPLFRKIYDEIKYLYKIATGKQLTEIEKVKREFDRAWNDLKSLDQGKEYSDTDVKYSIREEAPPKETGVAYKVFYVKDGKLYPPMVANPDGADTPMGVWLNADVGVSAPPSKTGRAQVKAGGKGTQGGSGSLAFRPGWHLGDLPRASQFDRMNPDTGVKELFPENFVWAEVEYAKDVDYQEEAMSYGYTDKGKFRHAYAGLPYLPENGYYRYRTNPKPDTVPWIITGAMKVNRLLSDAEVNAILEENGVPAVHRQGGDVGLDKFGFDESGKVQYSVSAETDSEYMSAIERGDTETAQRMVDEAAKNAGYTRRLYHGTASKFNVFGFGRTGIFTTNNYDMAKTYGDNVMSLYGKEGAKVLTVDAKGSPHYAIKVSKDVLDFSEYPLIGKKETYSTNDISLIAFREGYDVVVINNVYDNYSIASGNTENGIGTDVVYKDSNQVKSSEAVTYDNNGNVIPLSERFNTANEDIRYSISDSEGNALSEQQSEYFKDSKVRDENGNLMLVYHGSPNADFTVFKSGSYFTPHKWYADVYQGQGASSLGYKKTANNPDTYAGYLDIKKPFDTRNKTERDIFYNEYYRQWGTGTDLQESGLPDWLDGEDLQEFLEENGYDYDGLILDEGGVGGYGEEVVSRGLSYVIFDPAQFKRIDNVNPSSDPDMRFSLSEPVEETKDLVAIHNMQSGELMKTLELGGMPMPSIAVIKAEQGHEKYGDVSLIFPKDTIDPKQSKDNKVYGGDAWTPVYPKIEYKANDAVEKKIRDTYYELADKVGYDAVRPLYRYVHELEDALNSAEGEANLIEKIYDDPQMMQVYLADSGKGMVDPVVKETRTEMSESDKALNEWFIDKLGEDLIRSFKTPEGGAIFSHRKKLLADHKAEIESAWEGFCREVYQVTDEQAQNIVSDTTDAMYMKFIRDAYTYLRKGGVTITTETDTEATNNAIREKAADGYHEWVDSLFKGAEERTGIRNNKDVFTNSGNRRGWDALHWENTLENVVKAMKAQDQTGADAFAPSSALFAVSHKKYGSVDEIKADSDRLGKISEDEYKAMESEYSARLAEIAESIKAPNAYNYFMAVDNASELIVDAVRNYKTKKGMLNYMRRWNDRVTAETVDEIISLVSDIANMPTGYFEAKPQRAVSLEEVGVFVIPNNVDTALKQELLNRGYSIAEYDPNVEGDRQRVVNQFEELKFSLSNVGDEFTPTGDYSTPLNAFAFEQDVAPVADTNVEDAPALDEIPVLSDDELAEGTHEAIKPNTEKVVEAPKTVADKSSFISNKALALYNEVNGVKKGVRVSKELGYLLDNLDLSEANKSDSYNNLRTALINISNKPNQVVNKNSAIESLARKMINSSYDNFIQNEEVAVKWQNIATEINNLQQLREDSNTDFDREIAELQAEYNGKKNKNTKLANDLLKRIERKKGLKASVDATYGKRISKMQERLEKVGTPEYSRAMQKKAKMQEDAQWAADLLGDTSTWVDKKLGLQYATNTERRNLRDIVRDKNGKADIAKADAIDDALNGQYNREEAAKKRELSQARGKFAEMKITKAEDAYIQMLGELRHNPETTLTKKDVDEYYEKHKATIDSDKVDKVIDLARKDYDEWLNRVNAELRKQGMREIPYRQGYFPHFTDPKQNFIQKLLNWKTQNNEIPTSIAGLTETFKPTKSWQSFDKTRHSDTTDYSFTKGYDSYSQGVLDWIYHMDTLQKRRAVENHIRFTHSDEGIQARINEVYENEELDANEAQAQIEHILSEAKNPLNNFVQDFTTHTNILAGKKNSLDRVIEQETNRHIYSVMTNVQNRLSANMVLANVRSALTNFIPITQSWTQVSPLRSLQATKATIANAIKDDGTIDKSTFLTNRLKEPDNLHNTAWDKVLDKAGIMFEVVDNFSSQVIWRSKYIDNISKGMTESEAIANADQFAENVMAGRSKGNEPTLFNAKNPLMKAFTAFQLEVNNQYGYLFKDAPNDLKAETNHWKLNLAKGYTTAFIGAYIYNALLETVSGSGAALDPIGIIKDLLRDLGLFDDEEKEEPDKVITNLVENVVSELPFVGGLLGGGRIPISSALPYSDDGLAGAITDITEGNWENVGKELMNPLLNIGLPVGGGQLKKTIQGLGMFSDDHPVAGSYTDSGNLRFPVEDTPLNRLQAAIFGQYASENAREYFDNDYAPLRDKQIQEYIDVDIPIKDYWEYREGLAQQDTLEDKFDYIAGLDLPVEKKNILINNVVDRQEPVDLSNYNDFSSYEEFDFATKNPDKYAISLVAGGYYNYTRYAAGLNDITADKDANGKTITGSRKEKVLEYINSLDAGYETKIILWKSEYPSDDTYNAEIIDYVNGRDDLTYDDKVTIFTELGFRVVDGYIYAD